MAKLNESITNKLKQDEKRKALLEVLSFTPIKESDLELEEYAEMEFDTIKEKNEHELEGWANKKFYRVKGISDIVRREKQKPNSYITYIDDVAEEIVPEYISALIKINAGENTIMEVLASQILNYFGVPTVLNIPVKAKNGRLKLLSVDSISSDEYFTTFYNCGLSTYAFNANNFRDIKKLFKLNKEDEKKIIKEYVLTYLVRSCLLSDLDFQMYNVGILKNTRTYNRKLINFDFESTFWMNDTELAYQDKVQIERFYDAFPEVIDEFREKLNDLFQVIDEAISKAPETTKESLKILQHNAQQILAFLNKLWVERKYPQANKK